MHLGCRATFNLEAGIWISFWCRRACLWWSHRPTKITNQILASEKALGVSFFFSHESSGQQDCLRGWWSTSIFRVIQIGAHFRWKSVGRSDRTIPALSCPVQLAHPISSLQLHFTSLHFIFDDGGLGQQSRLRSKMYTSTMCLLPSSSLEKGIGLLRLDPSTKRN